MKTQVVIRTIHQENFVLNFETEKASDALWDVLNKTINDQNCKTITLNLDDKSQMVLVKHHIVAFIRLLCNEA